MTPIPLNSHIEDVARRIVWFEEPEQALRNPYRFMAYAFARATHEDMNVLRQYLDLDDFREALANAPPGIIDPRSWSYWNLMIGIWPAPDMPRRVF